MTNCIKIRKTGTFYNVFDDDTYIIYYFFNYSIKDGRIGFPKSALNKVINKLDETKVDYEVVNEDKNNHFDNLNRYLNFCEKGRKKYNEDIHYSNLIEKIKNLDEKKLNKILSLIEDMVNE